MPLSAESDCLYIPQTEYGSGLTFIVSGRRKAVKALYKACKRFYDILRTEQRIAVWTQ